MWVCELPDRRTNINVLALAPDGRALYSGDSHGHVLAWDLSTRKHQLVFHRPRAARQYNMVYWLGPTPDGARLLAHDFHGLIDALHPEAGPLLVPGPDERCYFGYLLPDGRRVSGLDYTPEWRVGWWDLDTGMRVRVPGALGRYSPVAWHALLPDGETLVTYGWYWKNHAVTNELFLWDLRTGRQRAQVWMAGSSGSPRQLPQLSPDGRTLATVEWGNTLQLYDLPSRSAGKHVQTKRRIGAMAFHPNNWLLALVARRKQVDFWDIVEGRHLARFDCQCGVINALTFAADGRTCVAGGHGKLVFWDVAV
jgi:WD40 repeat protein